MTEILIVEDHKETYETLIKYLSKCGYRVFHRENGNQALEFIRARPFKINLILLDIILPGKNGLKILEKLRKNQIQIPILMLTTIGDSDNIKTALDQGADDYVTKPFALTELHARIKALLRRPNFFENNEVKKGPFYIHIDRRIAKYQNKNIDLSRKEFDLLTFMLNNSNQTLSRDYILTNVWDLNNPPSTNTVDVHIKKLRNKIDKSKQFIQTIHGFGYRMQIKEPYLKKHNNFRY